MIVDCLYHHLVIVASSHSLQQLSLYTWSLTCVTLFESARDSIITFFNFFLSKQKSISDQSSSIESVLIKTHEILSYDKSVVEFKAVIHQIRDNLLDKYIKSITIKFKIQEVFMTVANIAALFEYESTDSSKSIFHLTFQEISIIKTEKIDFNHQQFHSTLKSLTSFKIESSWKIICLASRLTFITFSIILQRVDDENVFFCVHVLLLLVWSLTNIEKAITIVEKDISWSQICSFLNTLAKYEVMTLKIYADVFLKQKSDRSLSENFVMRDQMYSSWYYSKAWFKNANIDEEKRLLKLSFTTASRVKRILWLEICIASICSIFAQYEKIALTYFSLIDEYVMTRSSQRFKWENKVLMNWVNSDAHVTCKRQASWLQLILLIEKVCQISCLQRQECKVYWFFREKEIVERAI